MNGQVLATDVLKAHALNDRHRRCAAGDWEWTHEGHKWWSRPSEQHRTHLIVAFREAVNAGPDDAVTILPDGMLTRSTICGTCRGVPVYRTQVGAP